AIALLPDHPPASITWRGKRHLVKHADGPELVFGEWWKRDSELEALRDYFVIENEIGERFRHHGDEGQLFDPETRLDRLR
ncbi:DNA polymerase Y family protein, partial [Rhizobium ruizarguesonis]